jgi:ribonuclease R/exosome complex exonuclease DIS3/RRP44
MFLTEMNIAGVKHKKNMYRLGDEVYVKVKNADLVRKHLDFSMIGHPGDVKV